MARFSFTTMNLYNLQASRRTTYPGSKPLGADLYWAKIRFLGMMLKAAKADVFGFQELWAVSALRDAFEEAGLEDEYEFIARDAPGTGKPQVALAARKGTIVYDGKCSDDSSFWINDFPEGAVFRKRRTIEQVSVDIDAFSRPVLSAMVQPEKGPATRVMVAHLKSKRPIQLDGQEYGNDAVRPHADALGQALASIRRTAEAAALRVILNESMEGNDTPHVVMGDLNNGSLSVSTGIITGDPRYRLIESSRPVSGKRADKGLYSAEMLMHLRTQGHTNYTHIYENKLEVLDHILVSEEFYDHSPRRVWSFRYAEIFNDYLTLPHKRKDIEKALESDRKAMWPTDHGIARAVFDHRPYS
ncbi:MAG: endonuclease/exonuclease/phosphatase family protein [Pseudomonadota bacterium]